MSKFEAIEMDVVIRAKIVTYYPKSVIDNQMRVVRKANEALNDVGKDLAFLTSPVTVTISQGESK